LAILTLPPHNETSLGFLPRFGAQSLHQAFVLLARDDGIVVIVLPGRNGLLAHFEQISDRKLRETMQPPLYSQPLTEGTHRDDNVYGLWHSGLTPSLVS